MVKPHQGVVMLRNTFNETWEFLREEGEMRLETEKRGTPFEVIATITQKGVHKDERVIRVLQDREERARSYECCWGHYYNCNRTRIGMYCKALDVAI